MNPRRVLPLMKGMLSTSIAAEGNGRETNQILRVFLTSQATVYVVSQAFQGASRAPAAGSAV